MSLLVEGHSVVVRLATLDAQYPGGLAGYRSDCPNATFFADEQLCRIGFMRSDDARAFLAALSSKWKSPSLLRPGEEAALVDGHSMSHGGCSWLELGRWARAPIAWLAGAPRGNFHAPANWNAENMLTFMPSQAVREQLEYLRTENGVDVYRHKVTGQLLHVGRTERTTGADQNRHDDAYREACRLIDGLLLLEGRLAAVLDDAARQRLSRALDLFTEVVGINARNWPALWTMGKIQQRLGDREQSLACFARAHLIHPQQPDVCREAAIAALELDRHAEALHYCHAAVGVSPEDAGLMASLGLALLLAGWPQDSQKALLEAQRRNPSDSITAHLLRIVQQVLTGARPCPRSLRDLQANP